MSEVVDFISFTGASADQARAYLEMSGGSLEVAVGLFMEMEAGSGALMPAAHESSVKTDEEFARELSENEQITAENSVREAIPAFNDQLLSHHDIIAGQSFHQQHMNSQIAPGANQNGFAFQGAQGGSSQLKPTWADAIDRKDSNENGDSKEGSSDASAPDVFEELFKPPVDSNSDQTFAAVLQQAKEEKKLILVNLQDPCEFTSHALNRDVWSNETVQVVLQTSFLFWQRDNSHPEGKAFITHYRPRVLPSICIIEPLTRRKLKEWDARKWIDAFAAVDFLQHASEVDPSQLGAHAASVERRDISSSPAPPSDEVERQSPMSDMEEKDQVSEEPDEPREGEPGVVKVAIRFTDGSRTTRRFLGSDSLHTLFAVLSARENKPGKQLDGRAGIPPQSLKNNFKMDATIREADLNGSIVMVVRL